jgi:hypothetical protein
LFNLVFLKQECIPTGKSRHMNNSWDLREEIKSRKFWRRPSAGDWFGDGGGVCMCTWLCVDMSSLLCNSEGSLTGFSTTALKFFPKNCPSYSTH